MGQLGRRDLGLALDFVEELNAPREPRELLTWLAREIRRVVRATIAGYVEVDAAARLLLQIPDPPGVVAPDALQVFREHWDEHPFVAQPYRLTTLRLSDFVSEREFRARGLYAEFYAPVQVEHQLALSLLPRRRGRTPFVFLCRGPGRDFTERDRAMLLLLQPHIIQALHAAFAFVRARRAASGDLARAAAQETVILSDSDRVVSMTPRARAWLREAFCDPARDLPDALARWIRVQRALPSAGLPPARTPLFLDGAAARFELRLARTSGGQLLLIERRLRLGLEARLDHLTPRESEVLGWAGCGKTDREIGEILGSAPRTVSKHLERVYQKLGVETRTAAARIAAESGRSAKPDVDPLCDDWIFEHPPAPLGRDVRRNAYCSGGPPSRTSLPMSEEVGHVRKTDHGPC